MHAMNKMEDNVHESVEATQMIGEQNQGSGL